jgi:translation initiation factor 4E
MLAPAVPTPEPEDGSPREYDCTTRQVNNSPVAVPKPDSIEEPEEIVKLPLETPWSLYMLTKRTSSNESWISGMKHVVTMDTVQDFWGVLNNIRSLVDTKVDLYFFREGISPMWEDDSNCDGGRIRFTIKINKAKKNIDDVWSELLMAIVGEQFPKDEITGLDVNCRRGKFSIWTRGQKKIEECKQIINEALFHANIREAELEFSSHS